MSVLVRMKKGSRATICTHYLFNYNHACNIKAIQISKHRVNSLVNLRFHLVHFYNFKVHHAKNSTHGKVYE